MMPNSTHTLSETRDITHTMQSHVQQLALALETMPAAELPTQGLEHALKHFISGLKKFARALDVLSEKLDTLPEIAEYEALLNETYRQCDGYRQEILHLHEQLRHLSNSTPVGEALADA
jgi:uncharacterized coiled-coil DUF342 family protein